MVDRCGHSPRLSLITTVPTLPSPPLCASILSAPPAVGCTKASAFEEKKDDTAAALTPSHAHLQSGTLARRGNVAAHLGAAVASCADCVKALLQHRRRPVPVMLPGHDKCWGKLSESGPFNYCKQSHTTRTWNVPPAAAWAGFRTGNESWKHPRIPGIFSNISASQRL